MGSTNYTHQQYGQEVCEIQQVLAHRERSRGKKHKHQLDLFVSWKGMRHAHSEWLSESELTNAAEVVQDHLDALGQWATGQAGCWCAQASTVRP